MEAWLAVGQVLQPEPKLCLSFAPLLLLDIMVGMGPLSWEQKSDLNSKICHTRWQRLWGLFLTAEWSRNRRAGKTFPLQSNVSRADLKPVYKENHCFILN